MDIRVESGLPGCSSPSSSDGIAEEGVPLTHSLGRLASWKLLQESLVNRKSPPEYSSTTVHDENKTVTNADAHRDFPVLDEVNDEVFADLSANAYYSFGGVEAEAETAATRPEQVWSCPGENDDAPVAFFGLGAGSCMFFNAEQVQCMSDVMHRRGEVKKLAILLWELPPLDAFRNNEIILRARAVVAFHRGMFQELYRILQSQHFSSSNHQELQTLWFQAHYRETEKLRGRSLGPVEKYRLRKKYPLPSTIWDGEETVYCFKQTTRSALICSYTRNKFPNTEEKIALVNRTGLTVVQISNWFKNRRQRERIPYNTKMR